MILPGPSLPPVVPAFVLVVGGFGLMDVWVVGGGGCYRGCRGYGAECGEKGC